MTHGDRAIDVLFMTMNKLQGERTLVVHIIIIIAVYN